MGANLRERVADRAAEVQQQPARSPSLLEMIKSSQEQFALAMPKGVEASQLIRDALTCIRYTPALLGCESQSVLGGLMTCAQLGLRPGVLGHAWLVPFKQHSVLRAQLIIGYQGLVELAFRSGHIASITAETVYEKDSFDFWRDEHGVHMTHRPELYDDPGKPLLYYAHATLRGGGYCITKPMNHEAMLDFRKNYVKSSGGPWDAHFEVMAWKTMVKRLARFLPKSTEIAAALAADETVRVDLNPDSITNSERPEMHASHAEEAPTSSSPASELEPGPAGVEPSQ